MPVPRSHRRPICVAAAILAAVLVVGCDSGTADVPRPATTAVAISGIVTPTTVAGSTTTTVAGRNADRAALAEARAVWAAAGLHSYTMRYERSCFCSAPGTWLVHVVDDRVQFAEPIEDPRFGLLSPRAEDASAVTVDALFQLIAKALNEAASVRVSYGSLGNPTGAAIDWIANAVDDENSFQVSDLSAEALPPVAPERQHALDELALARARWQTAAINAYEFDYTVGCECPGGTWHVRVIANQYVDAAELPSGVMGDAADRPTVPKLFTLVERSLYQGVATTVAYVATDGHPTSIALDPVPQAADDEIGYTVMNLTVNPS